MFVLNSIKEMDYIPMVGDIIKTNNKDFYKSTFRVKPYIKNKGIIKDCIVLDFKVVSRSYSTQFNEWVLICEPTTDSLLFLLRNIKVK